MIYNKTNNIKQQVGKQMSIHTHSNHFLASKYSQRQKTITSNKYKSVIFLTKRIAGLSSISKIQKMTRYDAIQPDRQLIQTARNKEKVIQEQIQSIQKEMGGICSPDKIKALMKPVYRGKNCKTNNKVLDILRVKSQMQTQRKFPVQNTYTGRNKNNRNTITHTDTNKRKPAYQYSYHKRKNLIQSSHNNLTLIGNSNKKKLQQCKSQFSDQKLLLSQKHIIIPVINHNTIQSLKQDDNKSRLRISTENDDYICKSNRVEHHKSQITYQNQFKKSQRRYAHLKQLQQFLDIDIDVKDGIQDSKEMNKDYAQLEYQEYLNQNIIPEKISKIRKKKKKIHQKDKQYLIPRNGLYMSMYMRMHNHTQHQQMTYNKQSHGMNEAQMQSNKTMEEELRKIKKKSKKSLIKNYSFSQIHSMCKLGSPKTNRSNDFYKSYDKNKIIKYENANQQQNKLENSIRNNNLVNISGKSFQKSNKRNQKNSTIKSKTYFNNLKYRYSKNNGNLALELHGPTIVIDPW